MSTDALKHSLYQSLAKVGQALASANRLQLLEYIAQGERSVEELATMAGLSIANASQHLQGLRQAGLVVPRKDGQRVFYSIAGKEIVQLYCLMSFEAVSKLRKRGWKARRLQDGFPEWKAAGLPVE